MEEFGLQPATAQTMSMLRNLMPARSIHRSHVHAAFVYRPAESVEQSIDDLARVGLITTDTDELALTEHGREFLVRLRALMQGIIEELWAATGVQLATLANLAGIAVDAAGATGGDAFALVFPVYEPPGTPPATLLAERLTPLRFHRYDAHSAAWGAAGLTAEEIDVLPPGSTRDAIEAHTNALAAPPYMMLTPAQRFALCSGLGALPN